MLFSASVGPIWTVKSLLDKDDGSAEETLDFIRASKTAQH